MDQLELQLVEQLQVGNEEVFETIFRSHYQRLCNYANTILNDKDEAEEMVQNTFMILWENHRSIDFHTSLKSYLYKSVHNHCLNRLKHHKVKRQHSEHVQYTADHVIESTAQQVMSNELEQHINEAINKLPPQCKSVFILNRFEGLTYAEIAEQLSISTKTVDKHMVKALKILRKHLKDFLPLLLFILMSKN